MRGSVLLSIFLVSLGAHAAKEQPKPVLTVGKDALPFGQSSPEGAACDLARAFINRDSKLFLSTCIKPIGGDESQKKYQTFLDIVVNDMGKESKKKAPSPSGPKSIKKVFAVRRFSKNGPMSYGYSVFGFKAVDFVDIQAELYNGKVATNRTLVIQDSSGKWFVHPLPMLMPLLSDGLNAESPSKRDIESVYSLKPVKN